MSVDYVCYHDDTDLTEVVKEERRSGVDVSVVFLEAVPTAQQPEGASQPWKVMVTCPTKGCERPNVFSNRSAAEFANPTKVLGRPPTLGEGIVADAAKELGPAKSLTKANDAAKYVISNVALVALVVGGFGIFGDVNGAFDQHQVLFTLIVGLAAASLICAAIALFPRVKGDLNYNDLDAVAGSYNTAIKQRAVWAQFATLCLIGAIGFGLWVFFASRDSEPAPSITAGWDGSGEKLLLTATIAASKLPDDAQDEATLTGLGKKRRTLATGTGHSGRDGTLSLEIKTTARKRYSAYRVVSKVRWDKQDNGDFNHTRTDSIRLTRPPLPAKQAKHGQR